MYWCTFFFWQVSLVIKLGFLFLTLPKSKNNQNYSMQVFDTINKDTPLYTGNMSNHKPLLYTTQLYKLRINQNQLFAVN